VVKNFRFKEPGAVALSGVPETPEQVAWLREQGIRAVGSLEPLSQEVEAALREQGIAHLHYPVRDFSYPLPAELADLAAFVAAHRADGVLIH
jgi:hypothetical protein